MKTLTAILTATLAPVFVGCQSNKYHGNETAPIVAAAEKAKVENRGIAVDNKKVRQLSQSLGKSVVRAQTIQQWIDDKSVKLIQKLRSLKHNTQ